MGRWPEGFMWGTGASSTQAEGAAPASDWLAFEREGRVPVSGDGNGFGARYAEDFALFASLGLTHHRLSIEWARVEPEPGVHDPAAVEHYRNMLQAAWDAGVTPWICLHHFTLPKWFSDVGGFNVESHRTNEWARHVDFMAETFGDLAGGWKPVNETNYYPLVVSGMAGVQVADRDFFTEQAHLMTAEAAVRLKQTGKPVASVYGLATGEAHDDADATVEAVRSHYATHWDSWIGLFRDGVLHIGGREPVERPDLAGCYDIIGFSYYAAMGFKDGRMTRHPQGAAKSQSGYAIWPDGLGRVFDRLHLELPGTPVLVSELGIGTDDDDERAAYLEATIDIAHDAIGRGTDLRGIFHWTGVDNYEWTNSDKVRFGIIDRDRKIKGRSAQVLKNEAIG